MTVFSYSDLTLTIDNIAFTAAELADIKISKAVSGIGTSGISTSSLTGRVKTDIVFTQGAQIVVSYKDWEFPTYYIDTADFDGVSVKFTAYDTCKDLDLPFDTSAYEYKDSSGNIAQYNTSLVLGDLAHQIGFKSYAHISRKDMLTFEELNCSCRQLLQKISEADCGIFYCSNDDILKFVSAESCNGGTTIGEGDFTAVVDKSVKTITRLMIDDTRNNVTYDFGSGDYKNNLMLSGDFINESTASAIASQLLNSDNGQYIYHAFEISRAILPNNLEICGQLAVYGKSQSYRCTNITIIFGAVQAVAQLSASKLSENKAQYAEKNRRLIDERVKLGTVYGKFFVNKNGAGFRIKL